MPDNKDNKIRDFPKQEKKPEEKKQPVFKVPEKPLTYDKKLTPEEISPLNPGGVSSDYQPQDK
jgi:hypothetical protein